MHACPKSWDNMVRLNGLCLQSQRTLFYTFTLYRKLGTAGPRTYSFGQENEVRKKTQNLSEEKETISWGVNWNTLHNSKPVHEKFIIMSNKKNKEKKGKGIIAAMKNSRRWLGWLRALFKIKLMKWLYCVQCVLNSAYTMPTNIHYIGAHRFLTHLLTICISLSSPFFRFIVLIFIALMCLHL